MFGLILLAFFEIILFCFAFIINKHDIMEPAPMMCLLFFACTIITIFNGTLWNIDFKIDTTLIIFVGLFSVVVGSSLSMMWADTRKTRYTSNRLNYIDIQYLWIFLYILIGIVSSIWYRREMARILRAAGWGTNGITLTYAYRILTTKETITGDLKVNTLLSQLIKVINGTGYVYLYAFINNWILKERNKKTFLYFICSCVSLLPGLVSGGRGNVIHVLSAFIILFYILWHENSDWNINLSWKYLRTGLLIFLIGAPIFYYSINLVGRTTSLSMFEYIAVYFGASIEHFNQYITNPTSPAKIFGEETFPGIIDLLNRIGILDGSKGISILERRKLSSNMSGNVYTFFRRPYHDFGIIGMIIFSVLVAMVLTSIYETKIKKHIGNKVYWILFYSYLYYWIILSPNDQYSSDLFSLNNFLTIFIMLVSPIIIKVKFVFGKVR